MRHGRVVDHGSARKSQRAGHGVCGADELVVDESTDRAAGFEQAGDLTRSEVRQTREPDHGSPEHIGRGDEVAFAVEDTDVGGHPVII